VKKTTYVPSHRHPIRFFFFVSLLLIGAALILKLNLSLSWSLFFCFSVAILLLASTSCFYCLSFADRAICPSEKQLLLAIREIEKGHLDFRFNGDIIDESNNALGSAFSAMISSLRTEEQRRRNQLQIVERGKKEWERTFDSIPDHILYLDVDLKVQRINMSLANQLGVHPSEARGKRCDDLLLCGQEGRQACLHEKVLASGQSLQTEYDDARLGGHLLLTLTPLADEQGKTVGVLHVATNLNEVRKTREEAARVRDFLQQVMDSVNETIMVIGLDHDILFANRAAQNRYALPANEKAGERKCYKYLHGFSGPCNINSRYICPLREVSASGQVVTLTHEHLCRDGSKLQEELTAVPLLSEGAKIVGVIEVARDISEKLLFDEEKWRLHELQAQDRREQSIATLAGGIAHDFNNGLTAILGNTELLRMRLAADESGLKFSENIIDSVKKMATLTKQLLAYARRGKYVVEKLFIEKIVEHVLRERFKDEADHIKVRMEYPDDVWPVKGDTNQLLLAIDNVCCNAAEAMQGKCGFLTVRISNEIKEECWQCRKQQLHPAGSYVHVAISDSGGGIASKDIDRVGEPFYTTKFMGRGLGLAAATGILRNHGGCLSLESDEGKGTIVHLYLPRMVDEKEIKQRQHGTAGKKILVVDDEPPILDFVRDGLEMQGYDVLIATTGLEALDIICRQGVAIALVLLDVLLPGMDGKEVYRRAKAIFPALPIVLSSGYDRQTALAEFSLRNEDGFLQKPYTFKKLIEKVEQCLQDAGG